MRFAAIAPAGRRLACPSTAVRALGPAPPWVPDQSSSSISPSTSGRRPPAPSRRPDPNRLISLARPRTAFRAFSRRFGSSSAAAEQPSSESLDPTAPSSSQLWPKSYDASVLKNMQVVTRAPSFHFTKHKPLKRIKLYGDMEETLVVEESFQVSLGSALVVLLKNRKCKVAFQYPTDLTMWRINCCCEFEIAPGAKLRPFTEYYLNKDIYHFMELSEYCLVEFGGEVPAKFTSLFEKMKSTENKGYSFLVDPSLIPSKYWASAFLDAFHIVVDVMTTCEREKFLKDLAPYCKAWHRDMIKNPLLRCFVMFSQADGTFTKRDKNCPLAFLECISYALYNPLDYLELVKILGRKSYTIEDLRLLVQEKGGDKLLSDICNLLPVKYRKDLALERYLCREGSSCCPIPTACIRRRFKDEPCPLDAAAVLKLKTLFEERRNHEALFCESAVLSNWKLLYAKNGVSAVEGFWNMIASIGDHYSVWLCNREGDLGDCNKHEALNIVCGVLQNMYACRKYSFGKMLVAGTSDGPLKMKGAWVFPGVEVPRFLKDLHGMECYSWIRVDVSAEKQRELVLSILNEDAPDGETVVASRSL